MKKGFTLIEVLAVLIIIGIVSMIAVPTIGSTLKYSKEKAYDKQVSILENAARTYTAKHNETLSIGYVSVETLKKAGYLANKNIKNSNYRSGSTNEKEKCATLDNGKIIITYTNNKYKYKFSNDC
ncbi:MAG: type II secretion system protein [Bacilli bacterium]|nr:type II secretion system protein [Bacilli bacterium]